MTIESSCGQRLFLLPRCPERYSRGEHGETFVSTFSALHAGSSRQARGEKRGHVPISKSGDTQKMGHVPISGPREPCGVPRRCARRISDQALQQDVRPEIGTCPRFFVSPFFPASNYSRPERSNNTATNTKTPPIPPEIIEPVYSALKPPKPAAKSKIAPATPIHVAKCSRDDEKIISRPHLLWRSAYEIRQVACLQKRGHAPFCPQEQCGDSRWVSDQPWTSGM